MTRTINALALLSLLAVPLAAQEFVPPDRRGGAPQQGTTAGYDGGFAFGIFGFSTRGGAQVNDGGQGVLGSTIDIAFMGTPRFRLRPSIELGFANDVKSVHLATEAVYRFTDEDADAIPYLGAGLAYYGDGADDTVWPTVVIGFELPLQRSFNWLIEYHILDRFQVHRVLVGLSTRALGF